MRVYGALVNDSFVYREFCSAEVKSVYLSTFAHSKYMVYDFGTGLRHVQ